MLGTVVSSHHKRDAGNAKSHYGNPRYGLLAPTQIEWFVKFPGISLSS